MRWEDVGFTFYIKSDQMPSFLSTTAMEFISVPLNRVLLLLATQRVIFDERVRVFKIKFQRYVSFRHKIFYFDDEI